jgi:hypothetical protein
MGGATVKADYVERYSAMSQDELLRLAADKHSLTEVARTALQCEVEKRHLETNPPPIEKAIEVAQEPKPERGASRWARLGIILQIGGENALRRNSRCLSKALRVPWKN